MQCGARWTTTELRVEEVAKLDRVRAIVEQLHDEFAIPNEDSHDDDE